MLKRKSKKPKEANCYINDQIQMCTSVFTLSEMRKCAHVHLMPRTVCIVKCQGDQSTNDNSSQMFNRHQCSTYTIMTVQYRTARYFAIGTATVRLVRKARDWSRAQRSSPSSSWLVFYFNDCLHLLSLGTTSYDASPTR